MSLEIDIQAVVGGFTLGLKTSLDARRITVVAGPSGSGKTTLLRCIAGLNGYTGRITLNGESLDEKALHERGVGYVFQDNRLMPHLNVRGNLLFALKRRRRSGPTFDAVCERFQMANLLDRDVANLSGGEAKRVAMARAILSGPKLLLLDEPLNGLDEAASDVILQLLRDMPQWLDCAMIYVSHARRELAQLADDVLLIERGQLKAKGDVRSLSSNIELQGDDAGAIVEGVVRCHDHEYGLTEVTVADQPICVSGLQQAEGEVVRVLLAARDVSIARERFETSILNCLACTVDEVRTLSQSQALVRLQLGEQALLARITRKSLDRMHIQKGDSVFANIKSVAVLR